MLRKNPNDWYLIDGERHWKVGDLLAEPSEAEESEQGSVGSMMSIAEPPPEAAPVAAATLPPPKDWNVVVRESQATPGTWFVWHKELRMSRWLKLKNNLPHNVQLLGWTVGEQNGHEYLVPKLAGEESAGYIQDNAMWAPCRVRLM